MEQSKVNQILRVAKMYYELKMSQQDIGAKENISKSTVSRLLKNAMDLGFVEVRIRQPHYALADLEAEFTNRFGIRKVVIAADVVENREVLVQDVCSAMAADLRTDGFYAETDLMNRSLKAQLKYANKIGARYTLVVGDDELASGTARLKDMATGETEDVTLDDGLYSVLYNKSLDRQLAGMTDLLGEELGGLDGLSGLSL